MPDIPLRRQWWMRKRTWAALILWLAVAYPLSFGPVVYCLHRGWLPATPFNPIYAPLMLLLDTPCWMPFWHYQQWWIDLARQHGGR